MAASNTNTKTIVIRGDSTQARADLAKLQGAYASLSGVNPALSNIVNNLNNGSNAAKGLSGSLNAANNNTKGLTGSLGALGSSAQAAMSQLSGMGGSLTGIGFAGAALGITAVVGGLVAIGGAAVAASAKFESYKASLTTILGDSDKAAQAFEKLNEFATKTPFSLDQSVQGFIKLKALGLQPTEAAMTSYGNTASAMGKDLNQMVEAVADAATGEFERLKEFGIKAKNEGDKVSFTFQGVTQTVGNNSNEIQKYLMAIGNTQFAGAMEKQMLTFNGAVANLEDTWTKTLAAMGDAGLSEGVAQVINMLSSGLESATPLFSALGNVMGSVIGVIADVGSGFADLFAGITNNGGSGLTFIEALTVALNVVGETASVIGSVLGASFSAAGQVIGAVVGTVRGWFADLFNWIGLSSSKTTGNIGLSFIGVLRSVKFVAENIKTLFSAVLTSIGGAFGVIGRRIADFLSGNFRAFDGFGAEFFGQFDKAGKVIDEIATKTAKIATDTKGASDSWERLKGGGGKKGGLSLDQLAGPSVTPTPAAGNDKDKNKAAKEAADRAKREKEYWQSLMDQTTAAGMLASQAEVYNKQLELRKILDRDLSAGEATRVETAIRDLNTAKAVTGLKQDLLNAQNEYAVEQMRTLGLTESQKAVEDAILKNRLDGLNRGIDLNNAAYKLAEDQLRSQLNKNQAVKDHNALLARGADLLKQMSPTVARIEAAKTAESDRDAAIAALGNIGLSSGDFERAKREIEEAYRRAVIAPTVEFQREWVNQIDDLADYFGGEFGSKIKKLSDGFAVIADMMNGKTTGPAGFFAKLLKREGTYAETAQQFSIPALGEALKKPMTSLSKGFDDFKGLFKGDLATGITTAFTKMQAGGQIGSAVANIGAMFGLSENGQKGAEIGGTIGGLMGPIGSLVGSAAGAILGGLIKGKPGLGAAVVTNDGIAESWGRKGQDQNSIAVGNSVTDTLTNLIDTLGGVMGDFRVAIGSVEWNGQTWYRVSQRGDAGVGAADYIDSGRGAGDVIYDGTDAEAAMRVAVKNAIQDGGIQGLSEYATKVLSSNLDLEKAVSLAKGYGDVLTALADAADPIGAAARSASKSINDLIKSMTETGASAEDLANVQKYLAQVQSNGLKDQLSSINDFLDALTGSGSGLTSYDQLTKSMNEFEAMRQKVLSGDSSVDQAAFTKLGQSIFNLSAEVYGTATSQFQTIKDMLVDTTEQFADNVTDAYNTAAGIDNTSAAIAAQTASQETYQKADLSQSAIIASYLKQILEAQQKQTTVVVSATATNANGTYAGQTY